MKIKILGNFLRNSMDRITFLPYCQFYLVLQQLLSTSSFPGSSLLSARVGPFSPEPVSVRFELQKGSSDRGTSGCWVRTASEPIVARLTIVGTANTVPAKRLSRLGTIGFIGYSLTRFGLFGLPESKTQDSRSYSRPTRCQNSTRLAFTAPYSP